MNTNDRFPPAKLLKVLKQCWRSRPVLTSTALAATMICAPVMAQDVGGLRGKVTDNDGLVNVAGATVTVSSAVMPKARSITTREDGSFSFPFLKPGNYTVVVTTEAGETLQLSARVMLDQTSSLMVDMGQAASDNIEVIKVTGTSMYSIGNSSLSNSLGEDEISSLPIGQTYRDLLKLVPGVQYTENGTLGPSAGGSGADNKYGFDGADLSLPMFGNLSAEPSTHDIANVSMDRGAAKAIGFNRSGGFAINSTSKSGTNEFSGNVEYKLQNKDFVSDVLGDVPYTLDKSWLTASLGGPILEDELFFYASYYRPEVTRANKETVYGPTKDFKSVRDEYFGKLTWAPTADLLLNASIRTSDRKSEGASISYTEADSVSVGDQAKQDIITFDGSWLISDYTSVSWLISRFDFETAGTPDVMVDVVPVLGGSLNINDLASQGYLRVPTLDPTEPEDSVYNVGAQALIDAYGYTNDEGELIGGGGVGAYSTISNQNFARDLIELSLEHQIDTGDMLHDIHIGFKWAEGEEELSRLSNGWGSIVYTGGQSDPEDPVQNHYYRTVTEQMSFRDADGNVVSPIFSYMENFNFEINDTIEHGDFVYNIGVLVSKDIYYGQGLRENGSTLSGYELAPGEKYKMYETDWKDMIQPRLGINWQYASDATLFANYASYNPEASSLSRAASWDRNTRALLNVYFDENGDFLASEPRNGSSGKLFDDNLSPRRVDEITLGGTKILENGVNLRAHVRHRRGSHFWEDMPNNARLYGEYPGSGGVPQEIADRGLYIPNLNDIRFGVDGEPGIGGSSYVIAEVDGGHTKYWEVSLEAEYRGDNTYVNASYVWSHYYGNFDQDNTTAVNDANTFLGSSNYGDGRGRFVWDNKYGTLSGDKPHLLKIYGYYTTDWDANIGAYLLAQSGQPWEKWSAAYYGYNFNSSATNRYAEPAGSRRSASHWQLDLNYTQDFQISEDFVLKFRADLFNVFDRQTGYAINPYENSENFGKARSFYSPRRLQLSFNVVF